MMKRFNFSVIIASILGAFGQFISGDKGIEQSMPPTLNCRTTVISASLDTVFVKLDSLVTSTEMGVSYKIRRLPSDYLRAQDTIPSDSLAFGCNDVGRTVMVEVIATDTSGTTRCMTTVRVDDKLPPIINARLRDITVSCQFIINTNNLDTFGTYVSVGTTPSTRTIEGQSVSDGILTDFCFPITISKSFRDSRTCGTGVVIRKFVFADRFGNRDSTIQTINIQNTQEFGPGNIQWPNDTTIVAQACSAGPYPNNFGGEPIISGASSCVMPQVGKTDMVFADPTSGCPYIMRTWKVYEMCSITSDLSSGYYEHIQKIFIRDTVKPTIITACKDTTFTTSTGACEVPVNLTFSATDNCTKLSDLIYRYSVYLHSTLIRSGVGNIYKDTLPQGEYTITWEADDRCGNISVCTYKFTTKETKPPTPIAIQSLVIGLPKVGNVTVKARDFERSSSDNCSNFSQLKMSFSANVNDTIRTLGCGNLGENLLDFYITDAKGNNATVKVKLIIQDELNQCTSASLASIIGSVSMPEGQKVKNVAIILEGAEQQRKVMTDKDGAFSMTNLERKVNYELTTQMEGEFLDGIDILDVLELHKAVIGMKKLSSPYEKIGADINGDQKIDVNDLMMLWQILIGTQTNDGNSPAWRIIKPLTIDQDPWPFEEVIGYKDLDEEIKQDLIAIKLGDTDHSLSSEVKANLSNRSSLSLYYENKDIQKGQIIQIPIKVDKTISTNAQQFSLHFDKEKLDIISVNQHGKPLDRGVLIRQGAGLVDIALMNAQGQNLTQDSEYLMIEALVKQDSDLSDAFMLSSQKRAFVSTTTGEIIDIKLLPVKKISILTVGQNTPNPFDEVTNITFKLKEEMPVEVTIFDQNGKQVYRSYERYTAGDQQLRITAQDLQNNSGVFIIHIECAEASEVRKMLRIR